MQLTSVVKQIAGGKNLIGLSFITDDNLDTLYMAHMTDDNVKANNDPEFIYNPTDWDSYIINNEIEKLKIFAKCIQSKDGIRNGMLYLAKILVAVRDEIGDNEIFLDVLSSDPNQSLDVIENEIIDKINCNRHKIGWKRFIDKYNSFSPNK